MSIDKIVITGGPSGGKSTVLSILRQHLEDLGFVVILVTETATDLIMSGVTPARLGIVPFQEILMREQISREEARFRAAQASPGDKKVILFDRGLQDNAAYVSKEAFSELCLGLGLSVVQIRDERYDGVIFLQSPPVDKPEVYTTANNAARSESIEQAIAINGRTLDAWVGCPHLTVIDNSTDMEGKTRRVIEAVSRILGIPEPIEIEKKYLLHHFDASELPPHTQVIEIVQDYLTNPEPGTAERVRSRGQYGSHTYYHTLKRNLRSGVRSEIEHQVTREEYERLLERRDPSYSPIVKTRSCFVWNSQYFELDYFLGALELVLLEVELTREHDTVTLPPFITAWGCKDVTDDPSYSNQELARNLNAIR